MRLVIVGGVAGGMSCAARARRLDESADIIVLERGEHVSFANCGLPYFVGGEITDPDKLLVQTPDSLRAALNLDVRPGHDVTAVDPERREVLVRTPAGEQRISYDALVLAPGAHALRPPIDGWTHRGSARCVPSPTPWRCAAASIVGRPGRWCSAPASLGSKLPRPWPVPA